MRQLVGLFLLLYAFALLQMSFLVHFFPSGLIPNLVIVTVLVLSVFEHSSSYASMGAALFGGFLIDIFSGGVIGFWPSILFFVSLFIKIVLEDYVRIPIPKKF